MKLVFNRSLTGKCFSGNKFRTLINRRLRFSTATRFDNDVLLNFPLVHSTR
jgi:hypothetical protein